jgi:two-component system, cell cycle sensor histidine kinase and response regulator CckA
MRGMPGGVDNFCREYPLVQTGSYISLSVSDTGMGIGPATMQHIFEPFFTTKEVGKGTGLGLATVYGIVKQHGGFIFANSEPGKGTSFRIYFPAGTGDYEVRQTVGDDKPLTGKETILLVEVHDGLRDAAREMLPALGYRIIAASDGDQAVELSKRIPTISI